MGLIIKNRNHEIEISVKGYEIPVLTKSYWDNNWLIFSCRSTIGDRTIQEEFPCFMTMELQRLQILLEQFQSGELSSVAWNGTEPNLVITLQEDRLLNIVFYTKNKGNTVTFNKYATVHDVKMLIDFCADSLKLYPIREFGAK